MESICGTEPAVEIPFRGGDAFLAVFGGERTGVVLTELGCKARRDTVVGVGGAAFWREGEEVLGGCCLVFSASVSSLRQVLTVSVAKAYFSRPDNGFDWSSWIATGGAFLDLAVVGLPLRPGAGLAGIGLFLAVVLFFGTWPASEVSEAKSCCSAEMVAEDAVPEPNAVLTASACELDIAIPLSVRAVSGGTCLGRTFLGLIAVSTRWS